MSWSEGRKGAVLGLGDKAGSSFDRVSTLSNCLLFKCYNNVPSYQNLAKDEA